MSYADLADLFLKWWVAIFVPVGMWINKKRKEYLQVVARVEELERKVDHLDTKFDNRFDEMCTKQDAMNHQSSEMLQMMYQIKEDTAINKSRIDEGRR